jgi:hypothetical protein
MTDNQQEEPTEVNDKDAAIYEAYTAPSFPSTRQNSTLVSEPP